VSAESLTFTSFSLLGADFSLDPLSLVLPSACRLTLEVNRRMEGWTQSLRDELFLESTELRNYSKPEASKSTSDQSKGTEPSELERDDLVPDVLLRQG